MTRTKVILFVVLALLAAILVLQNRQDVPTKFLFVTIEIPGAILLVVNLLVGFVLGLIAASRLYSKSAKKEKT